MSFNKEFEAAFLREGRLKYTSPDEAVRIKDLGGETIGGLSRAKRPDWKGWGMVDDLKAAGCLDTVLKTPNSVEAQQLVDLVRQDYHDNYWVRMGLTALPERLADTIFDCAINQGTGAATLILQRMLNVLNRQEKDYADVEPDGDLGPATRSALAAYLKVRGAEGVTVLSALFTCGRGDRYVAVAERRQDQEHNVYGWARARLLPFFNL
jgi:hypothetical protein